MGPNVKIIRIFMVFRIFRIIKYVKGIEVIADALIDTMPTLLRAFLFLFLMLMIFSALICKFLKGKMFHCNNLDEEMLQKVFIKQDCYDYGGNWVPNIMNYDNII